MLQAIDSDDIESVVFYPEIYHDSVQAILADFAADQLRDRTSTEERVFAHYPEGSEEAEILLAIL